MTSIKRNDILNCINYVDENKLLDKLNNVYESLPNGNCSGCGNCCMESVGINLIEFINIYNYLKDNEELRNRCLNKVLDYYFLEYIKKSPCPFKDEDNRCMIYNVRPLNCRLFGHWKKDDYNKNLVNVNTKNKEYKNLIKSQYGFDISDKVVNYKINYCESFIPQNGYLDKSTRLSFSDELMTLDANIFSKGIIDIEFKDRGIVEYFIESLLNIDTAYNIKIKLSKEKDLRKKVLFRLKKILLQ